MWLKYQTPKALLVMKIPSEAKSVIDGATDKGYPCNLATSTNDGRPDIGIKASMMVYDDESLAYWERTKRTHLANVQSNPHVAVICWDGQVKTGYRFFGSAEIVNDENARKKVREMVRQSEKEKDPNMEGLAIIIKVSTVIPLGKARQATEPKA